MKDLLIAFIFLMIITSPIYGQSKEEKKKLKAETAAKEYDKTKELINSGVYNFQAEWATSQGGRRISLITNPNHVKIDQGEADIYLPYFGVVHVPNAGLAGEGGIVFKGSVENYKVEFNDKKQRATIKFSAKGKNDRFDFTLAVYKSGSTNINVSSNKRSGIKYDGNISVKEK
jgi:hypothetical protein